MPFAAAINEDRFADPRWRLSNLYTITDETGRAVRFQPNDAQLQFLADVHDLNIILKARQLGFCLDPNTRVLTADLRWVPIAELQAGQEIVAVDEFPLSKGKGQTRKMRTATVVAAVRVHRKAYRITFDDGRSVVCTAQHPWLSKRTNPQGQWRSIEGVEGRKLKLGTKVRWITKPWDAGSYEDGWFGGVLDGEGSISKSNTRASLNVSQRRGAVWDRLKSYLEARAYNYCIESDAKPRASKFGNVPVPKLVIGRMDEMFRIIGQTRPSRFVGNRFWEDRELPGKRSGIGWSRIVSIEPLGEQEMVDLQTSTGTYIAEGFVSHNTTLCCLIYLDACIFQPNTRAAVIAHKLDDGKVIFRDKIKFPYDNLDPGIRDACPATQDSADSLAFRNGSNIRVSTSVRSGTLQYLHVSEFGKLCAQFPERAREVVTGSLNTVAAGQFVVIESTAEGQDGAFYRMCQEAKANREAGRQLTSLDYKFHFFPWWKDKRYTLLGAGSTVAISDEFRRYFDTLQANGIVLTEDQKAWYVKKDATNEGDMKREYPSTPEEAFEQAIEGAIFSRELAVANKQRRIGGFPFDPRYVVNTFWDLGRNDDNVIWLHQFIAGYHRFVGYYENSGEFIGHYVKWLRDWAEERQATFGEHFLPHDGDRQSLWLEDGTKGVMDRLKFRPKFVERPQSIVEAYGVARTRFAHCQFDEATGEGLKRLRAYRKEWDEHRGVWKDKPLHDAASHGASAFITFACARLPETEAYAHKSRRDRYHEADDDAPRHSAWGV